MSSFEFTEAATWGGRPVARKVADTRPRSRVDLTGTIRTAEVVAWGSISAYCCALDDGTGRLDLLFLGRTGVSGLTVGACCRVEGTAVTETDRLVVWNPLYRLETPTRSGRDDRTAPAHAADAPTPKAELVPAADIAAASTDVGGEDGSGIVDAAGRFRIYLGAAAGVGKTVAMLDEAHRRRQRGADVVIGIVESHGRPVTEARIADLEVVPQRTVEYRGVLFEEIDLDAVLRRHPKVALVDELAHTNVLGSGRHDKRWQDVLELLEAGIDVITTVNIQHLESIADAVEHITHVDVRERVPDWVVRRADQIELVDSSPEQLRRRMLHGNIYPPDQVPQALTHFFRVDNLTALRELALRFLADEIEEELLEHLRSYQTDAVWDTAERIMLGVTTAPGTEAIVLRAARMAARLKADLLVVHVSRSESARNLDSGRREQLRQMVSGVGATWHEISADDTVDAIIGFARQQQITQIMIGSSQRNRWREMADGGSIVKRVTREATGAEVDVHIFARRHDAEERLSADRAANKRQPGSTGA
jgi:two-component system, OmpR family, sensor histidine kinase KdpD